MLEERRRRRWLLANGRDAEASVLAVEETGWVQADGLGVEIRLSVRIGSHETSGCEWVARAKIPKPGDRIAVRHAPDDVNAWAWAGSVERRSRIHHLDVARLHPAEDAADRLSTLEELRQRGVLSDAEYELQRNEVADEL